jgi:hypothetical protein
MAPAGWHATTAVLSSCADPTQALAITNAHDHVRGGRSVKARGGLVLLLEDTVNDASGFRARPFFRVPSTRPELLGGCCGMPVGRGYEFIFRDHGRDFEAFVYARDRGIAVAGVAILNSLRVGA